MVKSNNLEKKEWKTMSLDVCLDGTSAVYEDNILTVKGKKGDVAKKLRYPFVEITVEDNKVVVGTKKYGKRTKKIMFTYVAHIKNMVKGANEGFVYKLVVVFSKFPVTVEIKGNKLAVKNLLGEKVPRVLDIPESVSVKVNGKYITVEGIDKEKTGQVAANIEQLCKYNHLDRRVVQDGIYITEKPGRVFN
jgi:large subunit ribosomal protein L6